MNDTNPYQQLILDIFGTEFQARKQAFQANKKSYRASEAANKITTINDALSLHVCAFHFEMHEHCWGNLDIPMAILNNSVCDTGTALMMFYKLSGLHFLYYSAERPTHFFANSIDSLLSKIGIGKFEQELLTLQRTIYQKLLANDYAYSTISYQPKLENIELTTLMRNFPNVPSCVLQPTPGLPVMVKPVWYKPIKKNNRPK